MTLETTYLIILVVSMLVAFAAAVGAVLAGIWLAGRLTGNLGPPSNVPESPAVAVPVGLADRERDTPPSVEEVPWLDDQGNTIPVDPGKNEDDWTEAPA